MGATSVPGRWRGICRGGHGLAVRPIFDNTTGVDSILMAICNETIAPSRNSLNAAPVAVSAHRPPKSRNLYSQVVLFDDGVRPRSLHDFVLGDDVALPVGQDTKHIQCARAQCNRAPIPTFIDAEQTACTAVEQEFAEPDAYVIPQTPPPPNERRRRNFYYPISRS
jgi:hypothetical protein